MALPSTHQPDESAHKPSSLTAHLSRSITWDINQVIVQPSSPRGSTTECCEASENSMAIIVHNITATSAAVGWLSMRGCVDTFYSVMYHPDWTSLLMGHARKSFMREDRVPMSQTAARLSDLSPQTSYVLCVTCRSANPSGDQCRLFTTLGEDAQLEGDRRELAMGVWLASAILMAAIAVVLLWSCVLSTHPMRRRSARARRPASLNQALEPKSECVGNGKESLYTTEHSVQDSQQATGSTNPLHTEHDTGPVDGQSHKLMTPTKG